METLNNCTRDIAMLEACCFNLPSLKNWPLSCGPPVVRALQACLGVGQEGTLFLASSQPMRAHGQGACCPRQDSPNGQSPLQSSLLGWQRSDDSRGDYVPCSTGRAGDMLFSKAIRNVW